MQVLYGTAARGCLKIVEYASRGFIQCFVIQTQKNIQVDSALLVGLNSLLIVIPGFIQSYIQQGINTGI